ncbi:hypothetical protein CDAR_375721 [Caerostris darwini]|uniref:Uncharacterized protein n=1 Tax=Caerostris darwini TaxID=1538125 RepID=A0AAV4S9X9_9ARAC|nr:hypothetical protein CDAR_375721 [Caerostris darwini]
MHKVVRGGVGREQRTESIPSPPFHQPPRRVIYQYGGQALITAESLSSAMRIMLPAWYDMEMTPYILY